MKRYLAGMATGCALAGLLGWILAGGSAHGDIGPTGYTLEDIYQYIVTNGGTSPVEGDHSLYPQGAPGAGGMHTLKDILLALKEKLPCHGGGGEVLPATGQTKCYDQAGAEIDCTSADYPGQDGFYHAGCSSAGRFTDNGDGTVSDNCTGLLWQKETAPGTYSWQNALKYCFDLTLAGHTDWRLPNVRELESIVDYGRYNPSIDPVFGAVSSAYWSSSTGFSSPDHAWGVYFYYGGVNGDGKAVGSYVRAVRNGP